LGPQEGKVLVDRRVLLGLQVSQDLKELPVVLDQVEPKDQLDLQVLVAPLEVLEQRDPVERQDYLVQ